MTATLVQGRFALEGFDPDDAPILHPNAALLIEDGIVQAIGPADRLLAAHPTASYQVSLIRTDAPIRGARGS